jgi:predicted nucleic acid-binding protein
MICCRVPKNRDTMKSASILLSADRLIAALPKHVKVHLVDIGDCRLYTFDNDRRRPRRLTSCRSLDNLRSSATAA